MDSSERLTGHCFQCGRELFSKKGQELGWCVDCAAAVRSLALKDLNRLVQEGTLSREQWDAAVKVHQLAWLNTLESFHPHTGFDQWKCDTCGDIVTLGDGVEVGTLQVWMDLHFPGKCDVLNVEVVE